MFNPNWFLEKTLILSPYLHREVTDTTAATATSEEPNTLALKQWSTVWVSAPTVRELHSHLLKVPSCAA